MKLKEVLSKLQSQSAVLERLPLAIPLDAKRELAQLHLTAESIISARKKPSAGKLDSDSLLAARKAWAQCRDTLDSLGRRQIRILCWDKETALTQRFIAALAAHEDLPRKRVWIEGMISAYFAHWRPEVNPEKIEALLRKTCQTFVGNSIWISNCRKYAMELFSDEAARFIGRQIVETDLQISPVLEQWSIPQSSGLGPAAVRAAVEVAIALFIKESPTLNDKSTIAKLKNIFERLLIFQTLETPIFCKAIGDVILSKAADVSSEIQGYIKDFARKSPRLGDPRLPINTAKWASVAEQARRKFISWLAQDDLLFFFENVIPDRHDPHDRKRFWLQYLDYVEDSCVALSFEDRRRIRRETFEKLSHSETDSWEVSAFVMRFRGTKDIVIVEFSKPGNAIYIHETVQFQKIVGHFRTSQFSISTSGGLKDRASHIARFIHVQPNRRWQNEVRNYLAGIGIRIK
jgi:hypothetical protein